MHSLCVDYNLIKLLLGGPWSPFENNWHLKPEYKSHHKRKELANRLSRQILWVGIANLLFAPIIFMWQILYSFFRYAEVCLSDFISQLPTKEIVAFSSSVIQR